MNVEVHVDDRKVMAGLKGARREINQSVKAGLREAVEREALPVAKQLAPGSIRSTLRAGATTRAAYLETKDPRAGLLEFGGTRTDVIEPKAGRRAVSTPYGPRRRVKGPRRYKSQKFMQRTVERTRDDVMEHAKDKVLDTYEKYGLDVDR